MDKKQIKDVLKGIAKKKTEARQKLRDYQFVKSKGFHVGDDKFKEVKGYMQACYDIRIHMEYLKQKWHGKR